MKVLPLIYSRTKFCDYVSGFLVRPSDLNYSVATKYVSVALNEIKYSDGLRHTVFAVGDYIIYGGTACITSALVSRILKDKGITDLDYNHTEYDRDKADRPITFFIGFAVRRSNIKSTSDIPNIDLYETYKIYLKYLEEQWLSSTTKTQTLNGDDAIELNVIKYSAKFIPEAINNQGTAILKNYDEYLYQDILNFYYHELVTKPNIDNSFISSVLPEMLTNDFIFKNTSLYRTSVDEYVKTLSEGESKSARTPVKLDDDNTSKSSSSECASGVSQPNMLLHQPRKNGDTPTVVYHSAAQYSQEHEEHERKKAFPTSRKVLLVIVIALLVGIILLAAHRIAAKEKTQVQPQSKSSVQEQQNEITITKLEIEEMQVIKEIDNL